MRLAAQCGGIAANGSHMRRVGLRSEKLSINTKI